MQILNKKETKEIEKKINKIYNSKIDLTKFAVLLKPHENKFWISSKEIFSLNFKNLRIKSIGNYLGRDLKNKFKLSVEGAQLVGKTAKKNVCEIKNIWDFMRGFKIKPIKKINCNEKQYVIVKYNKDIVGIAKLKNNKLESVLSKTRKITSLSKKTPR